MYVKSLLKFTVVLVLHFLCLQMTAEYTDYIHPLKESILILSLALNVAILLPVFLIWIQSKARRVNVSDQSVDTNTSVGRYRLSQFRLFSNSSAFSSGPNSEVIIEEEVNFPYVEAILENYAEEEVPQERLEAAIRYLNTREGGKSCIQASIS